ncbi:sodium/proline symporter PutP [Pseudoteredinibacter isoporae]|uniref:Sodium/proline symporter n=1 Tax=Pseudoteredinibacter isoporae TaxID=570281 RepID=A0A7X0MVQ1_9GAMM|nr:sodium/proline symporter PutP [Pseudoteredinibacter isoporae]MBB6521355.1 sodium/proline symporter [Pseudoteredinibacter isoporae]NHO86910.1 sodium/proline symporter PutP [Pseudoteredinibacter isoporae]NIB24638.1 sodium/proline symporter PutP [Pseudoteredinibacter isoporae]
MLELNSAVITTFVLYLAVILGIGVYAWLKTRNASDYFLGGRNLSPFVAAISAGASDMSGWVLLGLPGAAYLSGLDNLWIALGLLIGVAANWMLCAKPLRQASQELDVVTLPKYLQQKFDPEGRLLQAIASIFILLFFLFYVAAGLIGGGKLFEAVFGLDYYWAVIVGTAIVIFYTLFGGFLAVSWTDVFQGLLMSAALLMVPIAVMNQVGGIDPFFAHIENINPHMLNPWTDKNGEALSAIAIISLMGWGLGYFGQPHILARFKAIASVDQVKSATAIALVWTFFIFVGAILIGLAGNVQFDQPIPDSEKIFMALVSALFHPVVAGILLAAILAAIMSTVDSQLLVSSSALAEDLYPVIRKEPLTSEQRLRIGQYAVAGLSILAVLLAMDKNSKVLDVVSYAWAGLGASLGPAILLSLYWKGMNKNGALAGVLVGGITVIIWSQFKQELWGLYELIPAFVFSLISILLVSQLTQAEQAQEA